MLYQPFMLCYCYRRFSFWNHDIY